MTYWQGKVVLITGGSEGLGKALGRAYAEAGANVMLAARGADKLQRVVAELTGAGLAVSGHAADVTRQDDVAALIAQTVETYGRLDVLVNNVGRSTRGNVLETDPDEFRELLELNFLSVVRCTQAAAPHLIAAKGHLVNIGSLASKTVSKYLGAYPASKFAVAAYSQQLRYELSPLGVHVLLVCPGPIARQDAGRRYDTQTEGLPESARQPGGGVRLTGIAAEQLSQQILRACQQRRAELIVPGKARWLFAISQLWPAWGDYLIDKLKS